MLENEKDVQNENEEKLTEEEIAEEKEAVKEDEKLEQILNMLKNLENQEKNAPKKRKKLTSMVFDFSPFVFRSLFLNLLLHVFINVTIGFLLITYFKFAKFDSIVTVVLFLVYFAFVDNLVRMYLALKHIEWIIASFGTIFFFVGMITLSLISDFMGEITFNNLNTFLVFATLLFALRFIILTPIKKIVRSYHIEKMLGGFNK